MKDVHIYGGTTTAYAGLNSGNLYYPPIGAIDNEHYSGSIHLGSGMKIEGASLDQNGRLASGYRTYVTIKPAENAGQAYPVNTDFDQTLGTVTSSLPMARAGEEVTLTAVPETDCRLLSLTVTDYSHNAVDVTGTTTDGVFTGTFTMPEASVTVNAVFESNIYPVEVSISGSGQVAAPDEAYMDSTVALTVTPGAGYRLESLTVTDSDQQSVEVSEDYSFTMPASPVTVAAQFEAVEQTLLASLSGAEYGGYTVTVNGGDPVSLSSDGSVGINGVRTDDTITVTFSPAENGRVFEFSLVDAAYHEHHHESDILDHTYTFAMPSESTQISVRFAYANQTESVSYMDENGTAHTVDAFVLTGDEPRDNSMSMRVILGEKPSPENPDGSTWYVAKDGLSYTDLLLRGHVHLIVADGVTVTVQGGIVYSSAPNEDALLSLYGQTNGSGKLTSDSFSAAELNVCSAAYETTNMYGRVNVKNGSLTVSENVVRCSDMNISGGETTVSGNVECGTLNISGNLDVSGNVECDTLTVVSGVTRIAGTVVADSEITLGCADNSDRMTFGSIACNESAAIAEGQTLIDDQRLYTGTLTDTDLADMAGQTLIRYHEHDVRDMVHHDTVTPTYDPTAGTYTDGSVEHYTCPICGYHFVEKNGELERALDAALILPYFRFRTVTIAGYTLCEVIEYNGTDTDVVIPGTVPDNYYDEGQRGNTVTGVDHAVFKDNTVIVNVTMGDGLRGIYESAFEGCTALKTVTAGSSLNAISEDAFKGCTALTRFTSSSVADITYLYNDNPSDPGGAQYSFDADAEVVFCGPHGSHLLDIAKDYPNSSFVPTDRHAEPAWTWAADYSSATAVFDCGGTCELNGGSNAVFTDDEIEVTEGRISVVYTASVDVDGETYTLTMERTYWKALQDQINAVPDGQPSVITLSRDIVAGADDVPLVIPEGKIITIDLGDHTINRHLGVSVANGHVFTNNGTLTLTGSGTVQGGQNEGNGGAIVNNGTLTLTGVTVGHNMSVLDGGAIYNSGTLTINGGRVNANTAGLHGTGRGGGIYVDPAGVLTMIGGTVTANTAEQWGGGIYLGEDSANGATLNLNGGSFKSNTSVNSNGAGIYVSEKAILNVSGSPAVSGNKQENVGGSNVCLSGNGTYIHVTGTLTEGAKLSVTLTADGRTGVFADGLSGKGSADHFASDDTAYLVGLNADGEAILGTPVTITFDAGDDSASGTMADAMAAVGSVFTLPACGYEVDGKDFKEWSVKVGEAEAVSRQPDETIVAAADATATAVWEDALPREPHIAANRLILSGVLGLQYHMELPEGFDYSDSVMTFSIPHRPDQTIALSEAGTDAATGRRVFECKVYAYQMADTITATFTYKDGEEEKALTDTYSVREYLESVQDSDYSGAAQTLVNAAWAYGHFIQPYLAQTNGWTVGEDYAEMPYSGSVDASAAISGSEAYKYTLTALDRAYVAAAQFKLTLNADTVLTVEVKLNDVPEEAVTMTVNGNPVSPAVSGKAYRTAVSGIAANNLDVPYTVTMEIGGSTVFDITVSPLSFVSAVLPSSTDGNEQNALAALYAYWQAAEEYNGN